MMETRSETSLDIRGIMQAIPHRPPLLLVDRVVEIIHGEFIHASKCVSALDPYFQGHFPDNPVFPGVYVIEGMAQATAILWVKTLEHRGLPAAKACLLTGVQEAKFRRQVVPGDVLHYFAKLEKHRGQFFWFSGTAKVDGEVVAEVKFSAMLGNPQDKKGH